MRRKNKTITIVCDKKILRMLMEDVRTPVMEVARNVGISGAAIHQRLRKLEKAKLISESNLVVNPNDLGYDRNFISSEKIRRAFYRSLKH